MKVLFKRREGGRVSRRPVLLKVDRATSRLANAGVGKSDDAGRHRSHAYPRERMAFVNCRRTRHCYHLERPLRLFRAVDDLDAPHFDNVAVFHGTSRCAPRSQKKISIWQRRARWPRSRRFGRSGHVPAKTAEHTLIRSPLRDRPEGSRILFATPLAGRPPLPPASDGNVAIAAGRWG